MWLYHITAPVPPHTYPLTPSFPYAPLAGCSGSGGPGTIIEEVVAVLWRRACVLFPDVAKASHAEWWAHCRPHSNGHQLHYDSEDEGRGVVRHPVASAVLALGHDGRLGIDTDVYGLGRLRSEATCSSSLDT
jgi:hypothetical protein